jgi:hypothetical protein
MSLKRFDSVPWKPSLWPKRLRPYSVATRSLNVSGLPNAQSLVDRVVGTAAGEVVVVGERPVAGRDRDRAAAVLALAEDADSRRAVLAEAGALGDALTAAAEDLAMAVGLPHWEALDVEARLLELGRTLLASLLRRVGDQVDVLNDAELAQLGAQLGLVESAVGGKDTELAGEMRSDVAGEVACDDLQRRRLLRCV